MDYVNGLEQESKSLQDMLYCIRQLNEWKRKQHDIDQSYYVVEECSEQAEVLLHIIKSITKYKRNPSDDTKEHLVEESCDTICTTFAMLIDMNIPVEDICTRVIGKIDRAMDRSAA